MRILRGAATILWLVEEDVDFTLHRELIALADNLGLRGDDALTQRVHHHPVHLHLALLDEDVGLTAAAYAAVSDVTVETYWLVGIQLPLLRRLLFAAVVILSLRTLAHASLSPIFAASAAILTAVVTPAILAIAKPVVTPMRPLVTAAIAWTLLVTAVAAITAAKTLLASWETTWAILALLPVAEATIVPGGEPGAIAPLTTTVATITIAKAPAVPRCETGTVTALLAITPILPLGILTITRWETGAIARVATPFVTITSAIAALTRPTVAGKAVVPTGVTIAISTPVALAARETIFPIAEPTLAGPVITIATTMLAGLLIVMLSPLFPLRGIGQIAPQRPWAVRPHAISPWGFTPWSLLAPFPLSPGLIVLLRHLCNALRPWTVGA